MNNNSNNKESDLLSLWEKAGDTLNNQQQLNKENMETLLNNTSAEFSSGIKKLVKVDAIFKVVLIFGFITIAALNLANLLVLAITLACIIIATVVIKQERKFIEGINDLQNFKGNIRNSIEKDIRFYQRNSFTYPFMLSISVFLFYVLGSLMYHGIKYENIKPIKDWEDAIVLFSFLIISIIISFAANYPFFTSRINYLNSLLKDIDKEELIDEHIQAQKKKKRKMTIIASILILIGIVVLAALIIAYL